MLHLRLLRIVLLGALSSLAFACDSAANHADMTSLLNDADSLPPDAASPAGIELGPALRVIVEPSDKGSALLAAIAGAKKSVHVTMYLLTDTNFRNALIARQNAGVEVKVVLNKTFPPGTTIDNQPAYTALGAAGVGVSWAPSTFTYTHEKCVIIDETSAWIMTMNATVSAPTKNREYLVIDTLASHVFEAEAQFAADYASRAFTPTGMLLISPISSRARILELISGASSTLDFEDEELSDAQIVTAFCNAKARGVRVRGVLAAGSMSAAELTAIGNLKSCGVTMVSVATPYIHAKAIAADAAKVYVGSENLTAVSLDQNRELGVIITSPSALMVVANQV